MHAHLWCALGVDMCEIVTRSEGHMPLTCRLLSHWHEQGLQCRDVAVAPRADRGHRLRYGAGSAELQAQGAGAFFPLTAERPWGVRGLRGPWE